MPVTATDIVNQALQLMGGNQKPVTGNAPNFDDSPSGVAAKYLYGPCVQTVARQFEWDYARRTIALTPSGNVAPFPWSFEFLYPTNGIQVWTLMPTAGDPLDPLPYNFVVANALVNGTVQRVVHTDLPTALAVYNNNPTEDTWDASFREAVVRLLASEFATALGGKPDLANALGSSYGAFEQIGEGREN